MLTMYRPSFRGLLVVAAVGVLACGKKDDASKIPLGANAKMPADSVHKGMVAPAGVAPELTAASKAALDSGNALFRKKAFADALAQYRKAAAGSPGHASPAYGIYMVARATNNVPLADSALADIRAHNTITTDNVPDTGAFKAVPKKSDVKLPKA